MEKDALFPAERFRAASKTPVSAGSFAMSSGGRVDSPTESDRSDDFGTFMAV